MLVLTAVISVVMLQIDWNGVAGSTEADDIDMLLDVMIVLSSFVYSIVLVMLGYSIWRYRAKPGDESDGEPIHGNTRLEIAWTADPDRDRAVRRRLQLVDPRQDRGPGGRPARGRRHRAAVRVDFEYPEESVTSTELHVPVDRQVEFNLEALDVIHSFWVPEWRVKKDAVPGQPTQPGGDARPRGQLLADLHRAVRRRPLDDARAGRRRVAGGVRQVDPGPGRQGAGRGGRRRRPGAGPRTPLAAEGKQIFADAGLQRLPHAHGRGGDRDDRARSRRGAARHGPRLRSSSRSSIPDAELAPGFRQGSCPTTSATL